MSKYPIVEDDFLWGAINMNANQDVIIRTMDAFCGSNNGTEIVDQTIFASSMINILYEACKRNYFQVVQWICTNFVPIDVSHDNNICYSITTNDQIRKTLSEHHSFCVSAVTLKQDLNTREKFINYLDSSSGVIFSYKEPLIWFYDVSARNNNLGTLFDAMFQILNMKIYSQTAYEKFCAECDYAPAEIMNV
jgi:hypothetical protein